MRVEIGQNDTTVSGDLCKVRRFDDLVIAQAQRVLAAPQPIIPIKPRSRYFSYLRVVGISTTPVLTQLARIEPPIFNLCTIRLTVEEFRYTHPTAGQANGSFPQIPTRTLVFVLTKAAIPAGFQGPAFEGDVFENGLRLPLKVSLFWVIGHGFNQLHPPDEGRANDNSIMTQSGGVRTVIENAGGTYPDDINFAFNAHNRHHLIHAPDVVVRPGGEDFQFGHDGNFAPEAQDDAKERGVGLRVVVSDGRLKLGQPLVVKVEVVNGGAKPVAVPAIFGTKLHNVSIVVRRAGREERRLRSFVMICHEELYRDLAPGKAITWEEVVYWDRNGVVFPDPGPYTVSVEARWFESGQPLVAESSSDVWVDYPLNEKENAVAAALLNDEVGKYVALGGNAVHLKRAVARIAEAKKAEPKHPALRWIAQIDEYGRAIKKKRSARKKRLK